MPPAPPPSFLARIVYLCDLLSTAGHSPEGSCSANSKGPETGDRARLTQNRSKLRAKKSTTHHVFEIVDGLEAQLLFRQAGIGRQIGHVAFSPSDNLVRVTVAAWILTSAKAESHGFRDDGN